jgi:tetratricopeptide (TPR) repeat protein
MLTFPKTSRRLAPLALALVLVVLGLALPALGQVNKDPGLQTRIGWVPVQFLERPVELRTGIGRLQEQITTSSKEAENFYDQGLTYLQSYVWIEAARSFHQALRHDPSLAMAYLGLSYAYSSMDFPAAEAALERAQSLASQISDRERRRIQIRALQLKAMVDPSSRDLQAAFRASLDDALAAYPDDVIFLLLRGVAQEPSPFADGQGCNMGGAPFFMRVLALDADNFAAHHLLTHCYENSGRVPEALPHAKAYAELCPQVPHAVHMYGHVLRRAGQVDEAIHEFLRADELAKAYFRRENIPPWYDWHYAHNLGLLASSYQYLGEMKNADRYFRTAAMLPAFTDYDAFNRKDWPEFLLDRGRYSEALTAARALAEKTSPLARAVGHTLAGDILLATHRSKEAAAELGQADQIEKSLNPPDAFTVRPYTDSLRAALYLSSGETAQAEDMFRSVVRRIHAANGPDSWTQGLFHLEFLCGVARQGGDWALAEEIAESMQDRAPDYAGSHYAAATIAQHNGDYGTAAREFSAAAKLWGEADSNLPELAGVHRALTIGPSR